MKGVGENTYNNTQAIHSSMHLLCLAGLSKVLESVVEGEDKGTDSSEEKTVSKPAVKEEGEMPCHLCKCFIR